MSDDRVFAKCAWRLMPLMVAVFFLSILDRVNVGFAALSMNHDLGFSPSVFGFGAGVFFIGYLLFQIPANLVLVRMGPQRWLFLILTIWGIASASTAFVVGPISFYALRFLLGISEAGLFPALVVCLTCWFPQNYRAQMIAIIMAGGPIANIVAGPLAGIILQTDGAAGLHGWQWLFLIEGVPALFLAVAVLLLLRNRPDDAPWLTTAEKLIISARLSTEAQSEPGQFWTAFGNPGIYALGLIYLGIATGVYGFDLWLPQIVQGFGYSSLAVGFLAALPFTVAIPVQCLWGRSSDRRQERVWHITLAALAAAFGFLCAGLFAAPVAVLAALTVARSGINSTYGPFWSLPAAVLRGTAAAGGLALISTIAYLGGFLGPFIIGVLKQQTGSYAAGMAAMALAMTSSAAIMLVLGRSMKRHLPAAALASVA